jgi:hypothetical protein
MKRVSDGAFKLFAYVCLKAERRTASYRARSDQLAAALGKSPEQVTSHILEMERAGLCAITSRETAYTTLRISDQYWPYLYNDGNSEVGTGSDYAATIRDIFLALGCTHGRFGASEESQVLKLQKRNIPLRTVREALMIGACRKYVSWLNNGHSEPISSIRYFEPIIEEIRTNPLPAGYCDFLPLELKRLSGHWSRALERPSHPSPRSGLHAHNPSHENRDHTADQNRRRDDV